MNGKQAKPTTLRGLAELLGHQPSALHKAIVKGRLTAGVEFGLDGRIVVTDAKAAVRQWKEIHHPTTLEMMRRAEAAEAKQAGRAVEANHEERIGELDALDLLAATLVGAALASEGADAFRKRARAQMRSAVRRHWGTKEMLEIAERRLDDMIDDPVPVEAEK